MKHRLISLSAPLLILIALVAPVHVCAQVALGLGVLGVSYHISRTFLPTDDYVCRIAYVIIIIPVIQGGIITILWITKMPIEFFWIAFINLIIGTALLFEKTEKKVENKQKN